MGAVAALLTLHPNVQSHRLIPLTNAHEYWHIYASQTIIAKNNAPLPTALQSKVDALEAKDADLALQQIQAAQPKSHTIELVALQ